MAETVFLSLGSNLGDRVKHLKQTAARLDEVVGITVLDHSSIYSSKPIDCQPGCHDFLNMVVKVDCTLKPGQLLEQVERIEKTQGRRGKGLGKGLNADRVIDIDIVLFGTRIFNNERLQIPHPRMHQRAFVLIPLLDIEPNAVDPQRGGRFEEVVDNLADQSVTPYEASIDG